PVATPALNPVSALAAPAEAAAASPAPPAQPDADEKPSRAMLLPHAVTGAWTTAFAWLPLAAPALLPVLSALPPPDAVAPAPPPVLALLPDPPPLVPAKPRMPMELPVTLIGACTVPATWLPVTA